MSSIRNILIAVAVFLFLLVVSFLAGRKHAINRLYCDSEIKSDTVFVYDTIISEKPILIEKKVTEPLLIPVFDTIRIKDTLFLYADREQIHWKDSLSDVYASGINVNVDSVKHYVPTRIITEEREVVVKVRPKWSIGVHAGYGAFAKNGQIYASPYIGIGVSYNILSW